MKALSIRQPWAYAILHLGKRLENRDWNARHPGRKFRGDFLIHASKSATRDDREAYDDLLWCLGHVEGVISRKKLLAIPEFKDFERGGIVGMARVDGIVTAEDQVEDFWFQGPLALALSAVRPLPFTPCNGQLGFFDVDEDALALCGTIAHAQRFTRAA